MPTFGSLFAGIGGIDLGLERAGWTGRWQVEWDPFCQRVLEKHWPGLTRYGDITTVDWSGVERVDLVAGGFPCQPVSSAGLQKAQGDERWLWPEFLRAIRALRPRLVLVENVTNLLAVNRGTAFGDVLGDLAASGYDAEWDCIPASAVGAPHDRDRVWIGAGVSALAYSPGNGRESRRAGDAAQEPAGRESHRNGGAFPLAHANGAGLEGRFLQPQRSDQRPPGTGGLADSYGNAPGRAAIARGQRPERSTQSAVGGGTHGLSAGLDGHRWPAPPGPQYEWEPERIATGVPARTIRLKALGNAVVPQVVEWIGRRLLEAYEAELRT